MVLSSGLARSKGQSVGQGEVPPAVWQAWIEEGILEDAGPKPKRQIEDVDLTPRKSLSTPTEGDLELREIDKNFELHQLSDDELKAMGKRMRITSYHLMKRDKLIQRITEQTGKG